MKNNLSTVEDIETVDPAKSEERFFSLRKSVQNKRLIALNIEICSACNLSCHYCAMHTKERSEQDCVGAFKNSRFGIMGLPRFKEIIDKCRDMQPVQVLYLHGMGEPLLNSEICEIIAYAKASGIFNSIVLITNGVLLSSNLLGTLSEAGLDEIRVSYDIFTPEKYLQLKGKDYSILVRSNIEECLAVLGTGNVIMKFTIECKRWLDENNDLSNETDHILEYFHDLVATVPNARFRIAHEFDWNGQAGCTESHFIRNTPCEQPFYILVVHWNGHVSPCCIDTQQAIAVGNIFEVEHLNDIISGWKLRAVRTKLLTKDYSELELCRTCNVRSAVDDLLLMRSNELLSIL